MKTCEYDVTHEYQGVPKTITLTCGNMVEGRTNYCSTHNRLMRKAEETAAKQANQLANKLLQQKAAKSKPKAKISKNPKDWNNTFLCSDGTKVTQAEINVFRAEAYAQRYPVQSATCHGCWKRKAQGSAHVIAQARCKILGKTELIWDQRNFFPSCLQCNAAIESPNGKNWKALLNITECLEFIKQEDPELFTKFENAAIDQTKPTI